MRRRGFLSLLGAAALAPFVPLPIAELPAPSEWELTYELRIDSYANLIFKEPSYVQPVTMVGRELSREMLEAFGLWHDPENRPLLAGDP